MGTPPGMGPGRGPGVELGAAGGAAGAGGGSWATGDADGLGAAGLAWGAAGVAGEPLPLLLAFSLAGFGPPNDWRRRRATGASTVDDADLTNSP